MIASFNIIEKFLYKDFKLYLKKLTHATIKDIYDKLNTNAPVVHSILLDSYCSLLDLVVLLNICTTITYILFIQPINPCTRSVIPTNATL